MLSFEQEVKQYFVKTNLEYIDNSNEFNLLDFLLRNFVVEVKDAVQINRHLHLEVKEKRQRYNIVNWPIIKPDDETYTFIVDELSCRKILAYAPFSGLLVRNNLTCKYYWFSILDLFLMPKPRVNRTIQKHSEASFKGKILLDFRNAIESADLDTAFSNIKTSVENRHMLYVKQNECHGVYYNESIPVQGITRSSDHWDIDVSETR